VTGRWALNSQYHYSGSWAFADIRNTYSSYTDTLTLNVPLNLAGATARSSSAASDAEGAHGRAQLLGQQGYENTWPYSSRDCWLCSSLAAQSRKCTNFSRAKCPGKRT
jgi:hypothetical protein